MAAAGASAASSPSPLAVAQSSRPVGKRGVQSGIFEDEQELLPGRLPNRLPALGGRPIQQSGKVSDTYWTYLLEPTTLSPY